MTDYLSRDVALTAAVPLIEAGFALHWLRPREKAPYAKDWSLAPVHTADSLRTSYHSGNNLGVRPGIYSSTDAGYLHIIDLDIRAHGDAARAKLDAMIPGWRSMPSVISGSGGESRHIWVFSKKPFRSRKLVVSDTFAMVFDPEKGRDVKKRDWEIDLFGSEKQVAIPPSIHPCGNPYIWENPLDLDALWLIDPIDLSDLGIEDEDYEAEPLDDLEREFRYLPKGLSEAEINAHLGSLPEDAAEDYDLWLKTGMALHHEYEGSLTGREVWFKWSSQSSKFDLKTARKKWTSFKNRTGHPVTMASVIAIAGANKQVQQVAEWGFDAEELLGLNDLPATAPAAPAEAPKRNADWQSMLAYTEDGSVKVSLHNIELIVENDPRLWSRIGYNELRQCVVLTREPARSKKKARDGKTIRQLEGTIWGFSEQDFRERINGKRWVDPHTHGLRAILEAPGTQGGYNLKVSDRDLNAAIMNVGWKFVFHPIRDRLNGLVWDGIPRAESLFVDYLGTQDDAYHRQAAVLFLLGAIVRVYEPGHKFDFVPILEGTQGKGKSTFIQALGMEWSGELAVDFHDNNRMIEALQGGWILEIPELQGFSTAETTTLKAVVSRTHDKGRLAWERNVQEFPRRCVFIGSTNNRDYLKDVTGGRRFWPICCGLEGQIDTPRLRACVQQIWAEAMGWYREMRAAQPTGDLPLYLKDETAAAIAAELQESRRSESPDEILAEEIRHVLDEPESTDMDGVSIPRELVCVRELWTDLLGRDRKALESPMTTRLVGRALRMAGWARAGSQKHKKYGLVAVYSRAPT